MTSGPEAFFVDVPGGRLHGAVVGAGPALLVLHGGPGLNDYSDTFLEELVGWRAITYHQRGPAPSLAPGPYTVAGHVADAVAVLDHQSLDRAVVVGHSWGAFLACRLAAAAPRRVVGLVLVDALGMVGDGGLTGFGAKRDEACSPAVRARVAELDARPADADTDEDRDEVALESFALMWSTYFADPTAAPPLPPTMRVDPLCSEETMESVTNVLADGGTAAQLSTFAAPVEIVYGAASPMPATASRDTAALFPNAVTTSIDGAGHFPWFEQPGSLAAALRRLAARMAAMET